MRVKQPVVAGSFYPADSTKLQKDVMNYLKAGNASPVAARAIIAPHAGYMYSGPIAGSAYKAIENQTESIHRVVLLGPCHRMRLDGLALPDCDALETPLGEVLLDAQGVADALKFPFVSVNAAAHSAEHSLEVHLPFLQSVLGTFTIVPFAVGAAKADDIADLLNRLWRDDTLIVISSDLSHYHDYGTARKLDEATAQSIEALRYAELRPENACGCVPVSGLLRVACIKGLAAHRLDLRNSGDTSGTRGDVVGYGAWAFA